ncbi:hypothetical protein [Slackia heliotrinireducens]|jgi:hypothetical protein|uniref:hypothetical protein n=1 Tax=Slackia heliotrinireducens TaxID=84110 RepID=UPI0033157C90
MPKGKTSVRANVNDIDSALRATRTEVFFAVAFAPFIETPRNISIAYAAGVWCVCVVYPCAAMSKSYYLPGCNMLISEWPVVAELRI